MTSSNKAKNYVWRVGLVVLSMLVLLSVFLSACTGGDPAKQQSATKSKDALDKALAHAQSIGVPETMLTPITLQAQGLSNTSAPLILFSDQPKTQYYNNLTTRYQLLTTQVKGLELQVTQQYDFKATQDMQAFEEILGQRQTEGFVEAKTFAKQLDEYQKLMEKAQTPKQFLEISTKAKRSTQALHLLGSAYEKLTTLQKVVKQLQISRVDVTALNLMVQEDTQFFRNATTPEDFNKIIDRLNAQQQQAVTISTQAIPYVGDAKLHAFQADIDQLQKFGGKTDPFLKKLEADRESLKQAKTFTDFSKVSAQIDADMASIQIPLLEGEASYLVNQFHQEVQNWGKSHLYHDSFNGQSYIPDYEYDQQGIGSDLDDALNAAAKPDDYQGVIDLAKRYMIHLKAMETDYDDKAALDKPNKADLQLMDYYKLNKGQVIVVSFLDQTMRLYQDGQLRQVFPVTTGRYERPSPPGFTYISWRVSPIKFKSSDPKDSPFYYPDTDIQYAMQYHAGGYFFHDSTWRVDYGPGTNFPHYDRSGDAEWTFNGSHGCINLSLARAQWLYQNTDYGTAVIIY